MALSRRGIRGYVVLLLDIADIMKEKLPLPLPGFVKCIIRP